jgi:general L-amino acid transport system permease protein
LGLAFCNLRQALNIGETVVAYKPTNTYAQALWVGLVNSLRILSLGIVLANLIGGVVGIARWTKVGKEQFKHCLDRP